jgi:alpha-galactosidase
LHPGEGIRSPRVLLTFWDGEDLLRGHNLFRQFMLAYGIPKVGGKHLVPPIAESFSGLNDYTESNQVAVAPTYGERGIEVQWIDAGWFVGGWPNGAGTWEPKPENFPRGLGPVGEAIHAAGMKFILWFEIERVSRGSEIAREHPDWVIGPITEYGGVFNWGIPAARQWMTDKVSEQIRLGKVDIFREDFNMEPLMYWQRNDKPDRQGMTEMRFVEGMYQIWDDLRARHPGLWIDNCASGGRMFDLETATRSISLTQSDGPYEGDRTVSTAVINQLQNDGLNLYLPMHAGASFGIEPSYDFRSGMTSGNVLAWPVDKEPVEKIRPTVELYKKVRPYFEGDYYPLFDHRADETVWFGYQLHRPDQQRGMLVVFRRSVALTPKRPVSLHGIEYDAQYKITDQDTGETKVMSGSALRTMVVEIPQASGSKIFFYEKQ